jgi:tetratricopeptide (TPR) repeat protein
LPGRDRPVHAGFTVAAQIGREPDPEEHAMLRDCRGNTLSTTDHGSVEALDRAVDLFARLAGNPIEVIDAALARDPRFVMGHCLKAGVVTTSLERGLEPILREAVEAGEACATGATERERAHLAAARAWLEGDYRRAVRTYARIAAEHPRDLLALQVAHLGDLALGHQLGLRDHVAQVLHAWDPSVAGYGYVLGMYAFGLEETGDHARAEEAGRRAVEINAADAWASHAVAHVMEMQGRLADGMAWLGETSRGWDADSTFAPHNWWHLALFHLDAGDVDGALALYDARIRPGRSDVAMELIDASALLWRAHLRGLDVGRRLQQLAEDWSRRVDDGYHAFNDAHALMAFLGAGRGHDAERLLASLERHRDGAGTHPAMVREVGLPLCRALAAFSRGDFAASAEALVPLREDALRFGGSNAQRDILSLTAAEAALRGHLSALALALTSERTRLRPTNPAAWDLAARALEQADGDASAARSRAQRLRDRIQRRAASAA